MKHTGFLALNKRIQKNGFAVRKFQRIMMLMFDFCVYLAENSDGVLRGNRLRADIKSFFNFKEPNRLLEAQFCSGAKANSGIFRPFGIKAFGVGLAITELKCVCGFDSATDELIINGCVSSGTTRNRIIADSTSSFKSKRRPLPRPFGDGLQALRGVRMNYQSYSRFSRLE